MKKKSVISTVSILLVSLLGIGASAGPLDPYSDSLYAKSALSPERSLQFLLDSLGYTIDVANDELGLEVFCGGSALNTATLILEVSTTASYATSGYYKAGDTSVFYQLFDGADEPEDSVQFTVTGFNSIGFYMKRIAWGEDYTYATENSLNFDGFDHAWVFSTGNPHEYLVAFEDAVYGGDKDYQDLVIKVRFANYLPELVLPEDSSVFLCTEETVCFDVTASDRNCDNDSVWLEMLSGEGTFTPVAGGSPLDATHCFLPTASGTYSFVFRVEDAAQAELIDTANIHVTLNSNPVVTDPATPVDTVICAAGQVCYQFTATDVDGGTLTWTKLSGDGNVTSSGLWCFDANTGAYAVTVEVADPCGAADTSSLTYNTTVNTGPEVSLGDDFTETQCALAQVCHGYTVSDPDGNDGIEVLVEGDGVLDTDANVLCFTPLVPGVYRFIVEVTDDCGESDRDTIDITVNLNSAPDIDVGPDFTQLLCEPQPICWDVSVTDDDSNIETIELISPYGYFDEPGMQICYPDPPDEGTFEFILKATDLCGVESFDTAAVTVEYNAPPELNLLDDFIAYLDEAGEVCFDAGAFDEDGNLVNVWSTEPGVYNSGTGEVCFYAESPGEYCIVVTAEDACGETAVDSICVTRLYEGIHVQVEKTHGTFQGQMETVDIILNGTGQELGGFDLLIAYDQSALSVVNVLPGTLLEDCGWEYFTYRQGAQGNCGSGCPSGVLRIIALSETNNGPYHPTCFLKAMFGSIASIQFLVSNDRTLECQYVPVRFFWLDCGDNSFSSRRGDTLWVSRNVYNFEGMVITDPDYGFPGYFGAPDSCLELSDPDKPGAIRLIDLTNGGIDIVCADSIDFRGDVNLNQVPYEIADAVLFSNYFVYGLSVFTVNVEGQVAATDVNYDGLTLSVADLVYLIRVVVGDVPGGPKPDPFGQLEAEFSASGGSLSIAGADAPIGAVALILDGDARPELHPDASHMELRYDFDGADTRVLIFDPEGKAYLESGGLLDLGSGHAVKEIEVGSFDGFVMTARLNALPDRIRLSQNYPNPFNPTTTIEFALPNACQWQLVIYDVLGRVVESRQDNSEAGLVKVEWDASTHASGVYFYRLEAGEFSDTRKMVLLK